MSPGMAAASMLVPYASWRLFQITLSQGWRLKSGKEVPLAKELQLLHTQAWVNHLSWKGRQHRPGPLVWLL